MAAGDAGAAVSAIYSPEQCDCDMIDRERAFPGLAVARFASEHAACVAWLSGDVAWRRSFDEERPAIERYFAVHGPRGHVIGVRP